MAVHSSILAWRIPWTEEPGGLRSMGWQSQTQLSMQAQTCMLNRYDQTILYDAVDHES